MKIIVVADVHGDYQRLCDIVDAEKDTNTMIFLGDGLAEAEMLQDEHPQMHIYTVRGNCDYAAFSPTAAATAFDGVMIFYTHGHLYGVKNGYDELAEETLKRGAEIGLFGHTHRAFLADVNGITLFNPGAVSNYYGEGRYGIITIDKGKVSFEHKKIK